MNLIELLDALGPYLGILLAAFLGWISAALLAREQRGFQTKLLTQQLEFQKALLEQQLEHEKKQAHADELLRGTMDERWRSAFLEFRNMVNTRESQTVTALRNIGDRLR